MLSQERLSWDNIAQIKTLCSVALEAPNKNTQEKIMFNVVLILLGQHCTGKNPMQCCPRDSRQKCTGKNPVQCCLNTLGATLHRLNPYAILSERFQKTLHRKNPVQYCLNTPGTTLHWKNPMQCCPRGSRQHCTGKNPGNVVYATSDHSVYICILGPSRQKHI